MSTRSTSAEQPPTLLPSRAAMAALLDGVDDPLLLFDDLGQLSFCNRAAMRALGAEPGQVVQAGAAQGQRRIAGLIAQQTCLYVF